jgi:hypothetical protein
LRISVRARASPSRTKKRSRLLKKLSRPSGRDRDALLALISSLRTRVAGRLGGAVGVVCCFEAGRDGFWLHRLLTAHGVVSHVLEPTSIFVNRRARRAKTGRLDAERMLRVLAAYLRGDCRACSMVRVPTPEEDDAKRMHREREHLVQEKLEKPNITAAERFRYLYSEDELRGWIGPIRALAEHARPAASIHLYRCGIRWCRLPLRRHRRLLALRRRRRAAVVRRRDRPGDCHRWRHRRRRRRADSAQGHRRARPDLHRLRPGMGVRSNGGVAEGAPERRRVRRPRPRPNTAGCLRSATSEAKASTSGSPARARDRPRLSALADGT